MIFKKTTALFCCLVLILTLLPVAAFAEEGESAIVLGGEALAVGDTVVFDKLIEPGTSPNPDIEHSLTWRVLSTDDTEKTALVLSDYVLGKTAFASTAVHYPDSTLKSALNAVYESFGEAEKAAVSETTLAKASMNAAVTEDLKARLFPLSADDAAIGTDKLFADASALTTKDLLAHEEGDPSVDWWLRTTDTAPSYVSEAGAEASNKAVTEALGVRPAFNLDESAVVFAAAAAGGKDLDGMDTALTAVTTAATAPTQWKLTLADEDRAAFAVQTLSINASTVSLSYSGAVTGEKEYISAIITDAGLVKYYGRLLQLDGTIKTAEGTIDITLPEGVTLDADTRLFVFNEQYNGGGRSDYSSPLKLANTCAVTLSANEGDNNGSLYINIGGTPQKFVGLSRKGYELSGYYSAASEGDKIINANGTLVPAVSGYSDADGKWIKEDATELFAQWSLKNYTVSYDDNGADSPHSGGATQYNILTTSFELPATAPVKRANTFAGWKVTTGAEGGTGFTLNDSFTGSARAISGAYGIVTLTAQWVQDASTVTLNKNGGTADGVASAANGATALSSLTAPLKSGSAVSGYYTAATGGDKVANADGTLIANISGYTDADGKWIKSGAATLYARWLDNSLSITYKDKGNAAFSGTHAAGYATTHTYNSQTTLDSPTKTGYDFAGWFINAECAGSAVTALIANAYTADITLYAKWTAKSYTVTLNKNGGGANGSLTANYGASLPAFTAISKTGSTLGGYYTAASGGTKVINANGTLVSNVSGYSDANGKWTRDSGATLYAQWGAATFTVTHTLTNITSPAADKGAGKAVYNTTYTTTLTPAASAALPSGINVKVGGATLTAGTHYSYDKTTGAISIPATYITGDVVITAKAAGNTYSIGVSPATLDFGSVVAGYTKPAAKTVTITNTGNNAVTLTKLTANSNYTVTVPSKATLEPDDTTSFTIQPVAGLAAGSYDAKIGVVGSNNTSATVSVSFKVTKKASTGTQSGTQSGTTTTPRPTTKPTATPTPAVSASLTPSTGKYDRFSAKAGLIFTLNPGGYKLNFVKNDTKTLIAGVDYIVNGNVYTIAQSYLNQQAPGSVTLTFDMDGGTDPKAVIEIFSSEATPSPNNYTMTEGANGRWSADSKKTLSFTSDGEYSKFQSVAVDGLLLSSDKYSASAGSTVIELKNDYLKTLSAGEHTIRINFNDEYVETSFTVVGTENSAREDNAPSPWLWVWLALSVLAVGGIVACVIYFRKGKSR